jgi:hypothetical protein
MDAVTYPHGGVVRRLNEDFVAVKVHIQENEALARRYFTTWTPGLLFLDGQENIRHRTYGFHPPEEFEHLLHVGHGMIALGQGDAQRAVSIFTRAAEDAERSLVQPEALFWLGISRYKTGDKDGMGRAWNRILDLYPDSLWARKTDFIRAKAAEKAA